ncbi:phosphoglucosamine mutase [Leptospira sp. GIMC2001]|uniref:phosphoglucosamine mutase n=1 Tax=Leptospira sp. GIMC2001 TaxID=1513297 RepID=UPI002349058A|nr:phosphoglucosamine mutase [Leptospira sp. GIMC2001]WCL49307.1 phosphoglucosamine mutase [Leptospira sp. GIMC2001]
MDDFSKLMISVSGVRGKIQDGFNPETILRFSRAFATAMGGSFVVVGRDSRPSGLFVESILNGAILAAGKSVLSLGIVPTPTVKAVVNAKSAESGVIVSASHNPMDWNAFKFVGRNGFFFSQKEIDKVMELVNANQFPQAIYDANVKVDYQYDDAKLHLESILERIDVLAIRKKKYKVLIDAVNGAGSNLIPEFLEMLGCDVYKMHCNPDGQFPRPAEPTEEALVDTSAFVKSSGVDIGFAVDPDADRLVVLTPKLGALSEEYTVPLSLMAVLPEFIGKPKVVLNESSSFVSDRVVKAYGGSVIRSKVGEANVVQAMIDNKAMFGGEGNGGVIDPKINSYGRDSLAGIGHILHLMAKDDKPIDSIFEKLPGLFMKKTKFAREGREILDVFNSIRSGFKSDQVSEIDGLRLAWDYGWIHVRPSNTEPIVRIIAEADSAEKLNEIIHQAEKSLS